MSPLPVSGDAANHRDVTNWIARHVAHMQSAGLADDTIEDRALVLRRLDRELPMGLIEATVEELEDWLARPDWCNQTKATYFGHLVGFYRWAADPNRYPHLSYDPSLSLTRPKVPQGVPRPVTDEQLATILDRITGRWRIYCLLAAYAGLRACEIAVIRREDITETDLRTRGKGGKTALIPTHPAIWEAVKDLGPGPIAVRESGRKVTARWVSGRTAYHLRAIGVPTSLHPLRHWFATSALSNGANLRVVQELMRHSSPATTAVYTQIADEQRRVAVQALPVLAPPAR